MLALLITAALVVDDQAALRAAPHDSAPRQAVMWRGDWLEVRGERAGFLQVYDHRRERPGYVRPHQVRAYPLDESSAPALHAVIDFLRDTPGSESLGIGYTALYLRAAPAGAVGGEIFDALGTMADRLGRRASAGRAGAGETALGAHLDVAASYGVRYVSFEGKDRTQVCYDGEAFRRLLALGGDAGQRARAALGLTRPECLDPRLGPIEAQALKEWRLDVLGRADPAAKDLQAYLGNRLRLRRAAILGELVFHYARRGDPGRAAASSEGAVRELALVGRTELMDEDAGLYEEVALRVGASRWAAETQVVARGRQGSLGLGLVLGPGKPGETCVQLVVPKTAKESGAPPLLSRCTYGLVWAPSVRVAPNGAALAVAVQPLPGWVELWLFRKAEAGWQLDTLTPAAVDPELGYVELAGWSPDSSRLLVVREALWGGAVHREFQVLRADSLAVEKHARSADKLLGFRSWQSPDWRRRTIALR